MKGFVLSVLALFSVVVAADGIKCYTCLGNTESYCSKEKLEAEKAKYLTTCLSPMDRCFAFWAKKDDITSVVKACTNKVACDTYKKLCDQYKDGECFVSCCETDECNAGSPKPMSPVNVAGIVVPLVIAVVLFIIIFVVIKCTKIKRVTEPAALQSRGVFLQTLPLDQCRAPPSYSTVPGI